MVAIDSGTGLPVRVGGAALISGPSISFAPARRDDLVRGVAGSGFPGPGARRPQAPGPRQPVQPAAEITPWQPQRPVLQATWGVPAYFAGAPYGPPYELLERTAEWELSTETLRSFKAFDKASGMALRIHPRGPALRSAGAFLSALFGVTPEPQFIGVGLDTWM